MSCCHRNTCHSRFESRCGVGQPGDPPAHHVSEGAQHKTLGSPLWNTQRIEYGRVTVVIQLHGESTQPSFGIVDDGRSVEEFASASPSRGARESRHNSRLVLGRPGQLTILPHGVVIVDQAKPERVPGVVTRRETDFKALGSETLCELMRFFMVDLSNSG